MSSINSKPETFVTQTASHKVVTVHNDRNFDVVLPPITYLVRAGFEAGDSKEQILATIRRFHPTSAAAKDFGHIKWYASKKAGKWEMNGPWAPKVEAKTPEQVQADEAAELAALERRIAVLKAKQS